MSVTKEQIRQIISETQAISGIRDCEKKSVNKILL